MASMEMYLTTKEVARRLNYDIRTVQRMCNKKAFPNARHPKKKWLIPESDVLNFTQHNQEKSPVPLKINGISLQLDDLKKLAERLEYITRIPKPDLQLLPDAEKDEKQIEQNIYEGLLEGDTHPLISMYMAPPWWKTAGSIDLRSFLSAQEETLLDVLLNLQNASSLKYLLDEWQKMANGYLLLKQANLEAETAYGKAKQIAERLLAELWKATYSFGS